MKILSWNVNGIRRLRPLKDLFNRLDSDIICVQETRVSTSSDPDLESLAFVPGYHSFFSICKGKGGYSGVATFCRKKTATPIAACQDLSDATGDATIPPTGEGICTLGDGCECAAVGYDIETLTMVREEGRCVITDHGGFVLINVYIPAVSVEGRATFKLRFLHALQAKILALKQIGRRVIVVGDFNICPGLIDSAEQVPSSIRPQWHNRPSRRWLLGLLSSGYIDSFREMHPQRKNAFTCWSEALRGRENNHGVRIDLILVDQLLYSTDVKEADVLPDIEGSDHCPISVVLRRETYADPVPDEPPASCTQYMRRFAFRQTSLKQMFGQVFQHGNSADTRLQPVISKSINGGTHGAQQRVPASYVRRSRSSLVKIHKRVHHRKKIQAQQTLSNFVVQSENRNVTREAAVVQGKSNLSKAEPNSRTRSLIKDNPLEYRADIIHPKRRVQSKAAMQWKKILTGPPPTPRCRHGLPCVIKTVNKKGENRGRTFYSCKYPTGTGKLSDCNFFQWAPFKGTLLGADDIHLSKPSKR